MRTELLKEARADAMDILRGTWRCVKRWKWWIALFYAALAVATFAIMPHDRELYRRITEDREEALIKVSNKFRRWGDFRDTVTITLVIYAAGALARRRSWRTAAIACFLSASIAGLCINAIRFTSGRPRPSTDMPDGFYGPTFKYKMQSFPSGHAGTSTGNAVGLLIALPGAGVPVMLSAAGVVWSCLYSRVHYVTDVMVGAGTGLLFGVIVGLVARELIRSRADPPAPG